MAPWSGQNRRSLSTMLRCLMEGIVDMSAAVASRPIDGAGVAVVAAQATLSVVESW